MNPASKAKLEKDMSNLQQQMKDLAKQLEKQCGMKDFNPLKNMNPNYPFNLIREESPQPSQPSQNGQHNNINSNSDSPFGPGFPFNQSNNNPFGTNSPFNQGIRFNRDPSSNNRHYKPPYRTEHRGPIIEEIDDSNSE